MDKHTKLTFYEVQDEKYQLGNIAILEKLYLYQDKLKNRKYLLLPISNDEGRSNTSIYSSSYKQSFA